MLTLIDTVLKDPMCMTIYTWISIWRIVVNLLIIIVSILNIYHYVYFLAK